MNLQEPLKELFTRSKLMILDFSQIQPDAPDAENIQKFFEECEAQGLNPRAPEQRQRFNDRLLDVTGKRYLVSHYGEDRQAMLTGSSIADEGRTLHMGIDIFCKDLETVYAPCDGQIIRTAYETQDHGYGDYLILKPADFDGTYFFFGHLSKHLPQLGPVKAGDPIATLGDYANDENGGWSRHLHLQMTTELPSAGETPIGYSTKADFPRNSQRFPNPMTYFPGWKVQ